MPFLREIITKSCGCNLYTSVRATNTSTNNQCNDDFVGSFREDLRRKQSEINALLPA